MKKIILVLVIAAIGMASFAQKITITNELYSEIVEKEAIKDSTTRFWGVRDRLHGKIEHEKWAVEARFGVKFGEPDSTTLFPGYTLDRKFVLADNGIKTNVWLKPWKFLTIAAGNTLEYALPGVKMVARDKRMDEDDGMWANSSLALAVTPIENLLVGVAIPIPTDFKNQFQLEIGAQYKFFDALNLGVKYAGTYGTPVIQRKNDVGVYVNYVGFENLNISAGYTGHFRDSDYKDWNVNLIDIAADYKWNAFTFAADATITIGSFDKRDGLDKNFVPFTLALFANYALAESKFDIYARVMLAWNQVHLKRDITALKSWIGAVDGAMSVLVQPGVKFALNNHHSFGAEVSMTFCKPWKDGELGFGISFPIYWKYTF